MATTATATPGSAALFEKAAQRLPAGVTSNVKFFAPYPLYMTHAEGARVWDVDGREYLDYCLAFGPLVTGHGHPRVLEAVRAEVARAGTLIFGAPTDLELRLADRLARLLPSAEMVRFTSSGTEATLHALRLARGATGRSRIVKFEGHYHGVHDHVLWNLDQPLPPRAAADGIPEATAAQTVVLPWNDVAALEAGLDATDDVAAVIVEPVARGVLHPDPAFLRALREQTTRRGIVLIFDEVVVWPRVGLARRAGPVRRDARSDRARQGHRRRLAAGRARRPARPDVADGASRRAGARHGDAVRLPRRHLQRHAHRAGRGAGHAQHPRGAGCRSTASTGARINCATG